MTNELDIEAERTVAKAAYEAQFVGGGAGFARYFDGWLAASRAAQPADVGAKQVPTNPICERKTNDIMQREGYQKTGYVLMKDDPAARICVSDQGAVSWFTRDQWNWLMHNRDHVEFQWPKPLGVRLSEASPQAAQGVSAADAVSLMLWLYRRLPRAYGRPPHVEAPIAAMAKIAGIDVADSFSERDPAPPLSSEQQDPPINQCDGCRQGAPMTSLGNHIDSNGKPFMYCQKQRYESFGEQQAGEGEGACGS